MRIVRGFLTVAGLEVEYLSSCIVVCMAIFCLRCIISELSGLSPYRRTHPNSESSVCKSFSDYLTQCLLVVCVEKVIIA